MLYTTSVEKNYATLQMLIAEANAFDKERVLNGLDAKVFSVDDVREITAHVREKMSSLEKEVLALEKFSRIYPKRFATPNNKCFVEAEIYLNRLRSNVACTKRMYKIFCKSNRFPAPYKDGVRVKPSVFDHSLMSSKMQWPRFYGIEGYDESVKDLCDVMEQFFVLLLTGLLICRNMIRKEAATKNNYELLKKIYDDCRSEEVRKVPRTFITLLSNNTMQKDELTLRKAKTNSLKEFIRETYHSVDEETFKIHSILVAIHEGVNNGLTGLESILWNHNLELVPFVRSAIAHFDEMSPKGYEDKTAGKYKLSAKHVAMFMKWCQITATGKEKQFIEEYFNKEYNGEYLCIKSSSVNAAKNRYTVEEYKQFKSTLDVLVGIEKSTEDTIRQVI